MVAADRIVAAGGDGGTSAGLRSRAQIQRGLRTERSSPMDGLESTPNATARTASIANGPMNRTVATITLSCSTIVTPFWIDGRSPKWYQLAQFGLAARTQSIANQARVDS